MTFISVSESTYNEFEMPCSMVNLEDWSVIKVSLFDKNMNLYEGIVKPDSTGKSAVCEVYMDNADGINTLYTLKLTKTEHDYKLDFFLEPACFRAGYDEYKCSKCQDRKIVEQKQLPHEWHTTPTIDKEPTLFDYGEQSIHCHNCNAIKPGSVKRADKKKAPELITLGAAICPDLSVTSGYDDIRFSWKKDNKANGYQVEYRVKGTEQWIKYKNGNWVTKNRIYLKDMKDGVRYQLRVRACYKSGDKVGYSRWAYDLSCLTLAKVNITSIKKQSGNYVTITWKGIPTAGEDGYVVYRSTSKNGKYVKVAEVYQKTKNYPSVKVSATKGTTYYYKVKAFSRWDGEHYLYGPWSNVYKFKR